MSGEISSSESTESDRHVSGDGAVAASKRKRQWPGGKGATEINAHSLSVVEDTSSAKTAVDDRFIMRRRQKMYVVNAEKRFKKASSSAFEIRNLLKPAADTASHRTAFIQR